MFYETAFDDMTIDKTAFDETALMRLYSIVKQRNEPA